MASTLLSTFYFPTFSGAASARGYIVLVNAHKTLDVSVSPLETQHWSAVRAIYLQGIATGNATFEQTAPDWQEWDLGHLPSCRLVAAYRGEVVGWAALSHVSRRAAYAGVAEVSVYVAEHSRGLGVGRALLSDLVSASERNDIWTLQAGILPENIASIELHEKLGFRVVGTRERLGCMNGRWRDVVLMERRSSVVGASS
jgi:phosphinothricin acetyltransferase